MTCSNVTSNPQSTGQIFRDVCFHIIFDLLTVYLILQKAQFRRQGRTMLRHEESIVVILFKVQIVTALSSFLTGQSTKVGYTSDQSQYHTSPVQNVIQCQTLCSYQPLCITFNYNVRSRSCGLTLGGDPQVGDDVVVTSKPSEPPGVRHACYLYKPFVPTRYVCNTSVTSGVILDGFHVNCIPTIPPHNFA